MSYDSTVTEIYSKILDYFDCIKYTTEQEMLDDIDELTSELIETMQEFKRRMHADSRRNAKRLSITVEEYEDEESDD